MIEIYCCDYKSSQNPLQRGEDIGYTSKSSDNPGRLLTLYSRSVKAVKPGTSSYDDTSMLLSKHIFTILMSSDLTLTTRRNERLD